MEILITLLVLTATTYMIRLAAKDFETFNGMKSYEVF